MEEEAPLREYPLRELFNALRYFVRAGCPWRWMPHDLPPRRVVYEQTQRWKKAGCFQTMAHDLRCLARLSSMRDAQPTAAVIDSRTMQSTPESGERAAYDGYKRSKGSKVHIVVDTLGHLLALKITPANKQDRSQVGALAEQLQKVTGENIELAYVDQGYTGENAAQQATVHGIKPQVVKLSEAKRGFILLPRRWVIERSFGWAARFRTLSRDYERLASSLEGFHCLAFASLLLYSLFR
jgi:transposase